MTNRPDLAQQITEAPLQPCGISDPPSRLDTVDEVAALEEQHFALQFIREQYHLPSLSPTERALASITNPMHGVDQIGNQFAPRLLGAYLIADPEEALRALRGIEPHTTDQELALLVNDHQFFSIHSGVAQHLIDHTAQIRQNAMDRLTPGKGQIARDDRYQFNGNETPKSLQNILRGGVMATIDQQCVEVVKDARAKIGEGHLPITEVLKNEKIISINGFPDSKISLTVHDAMDHAWLFNLLKETGILTKFSAFFESIGNPAFTDIYKREGEIVASIGFGVRYASIQENGFIPNTSAHDIRAIFEEYFDGGVLQERHMRAYKLLRNMVPFSREWQSLGFDYSNYIAELNEQRRKHGKIKVRNNETHEIVGELSETDPDFLSMFVETHHELLASKNQHRNDLFRFHILFEEYLQAISLGTIATDAPFNVRVQNLKHFDYTGTSIPAERLRWMSKNYGFTATKDAWV